MQQPQGHCPTLKESYELFLLERQGNRVTQRTIDYYNLWLGDLFRWLDVERPGVVGFGDLDVNVLRTYRAHLASRPKANGDRLAPISLVQSHRAIKAFLRWADDDEQPVDKRLLKLKAPQISQPEKTVFTIAQVKTILESAASPTEDMLVRILVGAGLRASEACGISLNAGDGLSDLMTDSLDKGRAELRVRWDAGSKGMKARRVPITKNLALGIKRYSAKYRPQSNEQQLLIGVRGRPFIRWGLDSMMDRIQERVGFRVHSHAFRHTFATVCTQNDWNLEKLRSAMGHADYSVLQGYVSLAAQRDLGSRKEWAELILLPEIADQRGGW